MFLDSTTEKSSSLLHKTQTGHDVASPEREKKEETLVQSLRRNSRAWLHRLAHVNEVQPPLVPQHVVLAEVSMD